MHLLFKYLSQVEDERYVLQLCQTPFIMHSDIQLQLVAVTALFLATKLVSVENTFISIDDTCLLLGGSVQPSHVRV